MCRNVFDFDVMFNGNFIVSRQYYACGWIFCHELSRLIDSPRTSEMSSVVSVFHFAYVKHEIHKLKPQQCR